MGRSRKIDESVISRNFLKAGGPALTQVIYSFSAYGIWYIFYVQITIHEF